MNINKLPLSIFLAGAIFFLLLYYIVEVTSVSVEYNLMFNVLEPLLISFIFLPIPFLIITFLNEDLTRVLLKKFFSWYIPISGLLIVMTPVFPAGDFLVLSPDKEVVTWTLGIIYLVASLGIIIYQLLKSKS